MNQLKSQCRNSNASGVAYTYRPVIEYFDKVDSITKRHISDNGYFNFMFKKGQRVNLRYCYGTVSEKIFIDKWYDIWGFTIFSVLIGCSLVAFGFIKLTH